MSALSVVVAYALGSVPFALIVARLFGTPDLRLVGSGNLGATNVSRASGLWAGLLVFVLDVGKGVLAVVVAGRLTG